MPLDIAMGERICLIGNNPAATTGFHRENWLDSL